MGRDMSARAAAVALLKNDPGLALFADRVPEKWEVGKTHEVMNYVRENVMNTWTLTLAAEAAGCSEEQAIAALLHLAPFNTGSVSVCRGYARELFMFEASV
jgi:hypothetical protein